MPVFSTNAFSVYYLIEITVVYFSLLCMIFMINDTLFVFEFCTFPEKEQEMNKICNFVIKY